MDKRITHEECMMSIAYVVSARSTCRRRAVGAVITDSKGVVLSTGFNGVPAGMTHCLDQPCPGADKESGQGLDACEAIHAEQNALLHCEALERARILYCTTQPCMSCIKSLLVTNINTIIYDQPYPHKDAAELWRRGNREIHQYAYSSDVLTGVRLEATAFAAGLIGSPVIGFGHGDERS